MYVVDHTYHNDHCSYQMLTKGGDKLSVNIWGIKKSEANKNQLLESLRPRTL